MPAYAAVAITTLLSYPFVLAILAKRVLLVMAVEWLMTFFGVGLLHGLAPILASESFPTKFRYSGAGISYSLSAILGGMLAPTVLAGLIGNDVPHRWYNMPIVYGLYCVAAALSLLLIRETRDLTMEDLDREVGPSLKLSAGKALCFKRVRGQSTPPLASLHHIHCPLSARPMEPISRCDAHPGRESEMAARRSCISRTCPYAVPSQLEGVLSTY